MKRLFKTFAIAIIALAAVFACAFAAGCTKEGSEGGTATSDYNFTIVYEDGTPVNGQKDSTLATGKVVFQICTDRCIDLSVPAINKFPDEKGKISISQADINTWFGSTTDITSFTAHVKFVKDHKEDVEFEVTNGKGNYTITVTK